MRFGVNLLIWTGSFDERHLPLLPRIRAAGFDGVEVPMYKGRDFAVSALRKGLSDTGMTCTICSVLVDGLSLISDDVGIRTRAAEQLRENIAVTAEVGAKIIAGPMYSPVGYLPGRRRTTEEWKRGVDCWQQLGQWLAQHEVVAAIEPLNRFETFFLNTASDAASFCAEVGHPNVGVLLDTFHANIEEKTIADAIRRVAPHLKHVHTSENDRGTPGSGHIDWRSVFEAIRETGFDEWLTIESFGSNVPEIATAASIWRDLATTPEAVAFDGIRFLQQMADSVR